MNDKCIIQRYLDNPYLVNGLKFDMRLYVLLAGLSPMRIFLYSDGLARFATVPYEQPSKKNLNNLMMHLTNYSINKHSKDFVFNETSDDMNIGHKRSIKCVFEVYFYFYEFMGTRF